MSVFVQIADKLWLNTAQIIAVWNDGEKWKCSTAESEDAAPSVYEVREQFVERFLSLTINP